MDKRTILVVDDDQGLRELIRIGLEHEGYGVLQSGDGLQCVHAVREQRPDMLILDIMIPEIDGLETCRRIRAFSQLPILMLTARNQVEDVIIGLDQGADDYLPKPFKMEELSARIRALLRRIPPVYRPLRAGDGTLQINPQTREVVVRGNVVDLTPIEYQLLLMLADHVGTVVPHKTLLCAVWGEEGAHDNDYLKVYIWHLRRKLEENPRNPRLLLTEWGIGYRLQP